MSAVHMYATLWRSHSCMHCTVCMYMVISNLIKCFLTVNRGSLLLSLILVFLLMLLLKYWGYRNLSMSQIESTPPLLTCVSVLCQWCWWTGGFAMQNVSTYSLFLSSSHFLPMSISFCPFLPLSPPLLPLPLYSSGYSLLHVTGEDTWKRIQLQIWHLVARMPAVRGKLWEYVHTLSPCSRLWEWRENTVAETHVNKTMPNPTCNKVL